MLSRLNLSSNPTRMFKAGYRMRIHLWTATYVGRGTKSDQAYISQTKGECSPALATPLPDPGGGVIPVAIVLEVGEELWAVSESVSLLGMSIERA